MAFSFPRVAFAAYTWTERQPAGNVDKNWTTADSDSDGSNLITAVSSGRLYTSSDYGVNWTERQPAGDVNKGWKEVSSDSDGSNLIAAACLGRLYTSSDYGVNWTERQPAGDADKCWQSVASDSDGSNLIAVVYGGRLYTSSDSGANWTERQPAGAADKNWQTVASDSDGSNLIAAVDGGRVYTSSDSGANWTERQPLGGAFDLAWEHVTSDGDGSVLMVSLDASRKGPYISQDSGATWSLAQPSGGDFNYWYGIAADDDGSVLVAPENSYSKRIFISSDTGGTWTAETSPTDDEWYSVASDADGSHLIIGSYSGRIYTGVLDTTGPSLSFVDTVEAGPVPTDTITADWGDASVSKWEYDADGTCSTTAGDYTKTSSDSMSQSTTTNNGKYICLYGEDSGGNKSTLASPNDINIGSASSDTSTSGSSGGSVEIPQIQFEGSTVDRMVVATPTKDSNTQGQGVVTIAPPRAFHFNAFLSAQVDQHLRVTRSLAQKSVTPIGYVQHIWYKAYSPNSDSSSPIIIPELQYAPSIIALSYAGISVGALNPQKFKLAHSIDGIHWEIVPNSVVDTANKTVAVIQKVGGYYSIVSTLNVPNPNSSPTQAMTTETTSPTVRPMASPTFTVSPNTTRAVKKCFLWWCW